MSNSLGSTEYPVSSGEVTWGDPYPGTRNYGITLDIPYYTTSATAAPSGGATVPYTINAYHEAAMLRDGEQLTYYYKHYTSWSEAHDDDNHRALSRTTTETVTELAPGSSWQTVSGDNSTFSSLPAWCSASNGVITIAAQSSGAQARHGNVMVRNTSAPTNDITDMEVLYQKKFILSFYV